MKEFRTLLFLDWFRVFFEKAGFDYPLLRRILQVKLTMDQRRVPTVFKQRGKSKSSKDENRYIKSLWIYALYGLFVLPFILMGDNYLFQMSIAFSVLFFIVTTSMISDFSVVILDLRDNTILFTKPVERKTISMAKSLHVWIYLFFLTGALTAIPLIVSLINQGVLFFLIFLIGIILMDIFIVVFTAMLYFFILHYFDGEKLKDVINYVQIGLSIGLAVGYQVVLRSFQFVDLDIVFTAHWWHLFLPPMWLGAPFEWFLNGNQSSLIIGLTVLAIAGPFLSLGIYVKTLPQFERNLQKLSAHSGQKKKKYTRLGNGILKLLCKSKEERTFYRFAQNMMKNERDFKLKVYPALGISIILPFIFIFNQLIDSSWADVSSSRTYFSIYSSFIVIPTVVMLLNYSGKYKGSWIYKVAPISSRQPIIKGTLKAFLVQLFFPLYVLLSIAFVVIFGIGVIPQLIIVFVSACIYTIVCMKLMNGALPFSESFEGIQQSDNWKLLPFYLFVGLFIGMHILSLNFGYGIYFYMVLLVIINLILWRTVFRK